MTPDCYEEIEFEMNHELGNDEAREINRRVEHARAARRQPGAGMPEQTATRCPEHDLSLPCTACAGDHLAGAHLFGSHEATCARCVVPAPTTPTAQLDAMSLAAGDDTLTDPDETSTANEGTER